MSNEDKQAVEGFKKDAFKMLNSAIADCGGLPACVAVLLKDENDLYKAVLTHIPENFFMNDKSKDEFVDELLPRLFRNFIDENKYPICFMFASEAYVSVVDLNNSKTNSEDLFNKLKDENFVTEEKIKDYLNKDELKMIKNECVIFSFETLQDSELKVIKIKREGKIVNDKGELVDAIQFEDFDLGEQEDSIKNASGRFSNILKNFYKNFANIS